MGRGDDKVCFRSMRMCINFATLPGMISRIKSKIVASLRLEPQSDSSHVTEKSDEP